MYMLEKNLFLGTTHTAVIKGLIQNTGVESVSTILSIDLADQLCALKSLT